MLNMIIYVDGDGVFGNLIVISDILYFCVKIYYKGLSHFTQNYQKSL